MSDDCERVHALNDTVQQCAFVRRAADCHVDEAWLAYTTFAYCGPGSPYLPGLVALFWVLLLFTVLGITADDFLCPALVVMSRTLRLSESVAGVTLLAFGNGAPDIVSSLAGIEQERPALVVGELLGAGTFVTSVVAGAVFFSCRFQLDAPSFLRDVIFYLAASFWTFELFYEGSVTLGHAIGFLALYAVYIGVVLFGHFCRQRPKDSDDAEREPPVASFPAQITGQGPGQDPGQFLQPPPSPLSPTDKRPSLASVSSDGLTDEALSSLRRRRTSSVSSIHRHHQHAITAILQSSQEGAAAERRISQCSRPESPGFLVSERTPLLGAAPTSESSFIGEEEESSGPWAEFLSQLVPWDPLQWNERGCFGKLYDVVTFPLRFLLVTTVPVVDYENAKNNWCRPLNTLHCVVAPIFVSVVLEKANVVVFGVLPAWALALCVGVLVALVVWFASDFEREPRFHLVFGLAGFALSVLWIYAVARELLGLLRAFGLVVNASDGVLGLTVLAWGNSMGDLVTNVVVARQGYPNMAMAACFGGPLLNLLLGVGLPYVVRLASSAAAMPLQFTPLVAVLYGGLVSSLSLSLLVQLVTGFRSSRVHSVLLWSVYLVFISIAVFVEVKLS